MNGKLNIQRDTKTRTSRITYIEDYDSYIYKHAKRIDD